MTFERWLNKAVREEGHTLCVKDAYKAGLQQAIELCGDKSIPYDSERDYVQYNQAVSDCIEEIQREIATT